MSEYPYRTYSPAGPNTNRSPTRRPIIPPAGTYPPANDWDRNVNSMPGFEGWKAEDASDVSYASTPNIIPEVVLKPGVAASDPFLIPQPSPIPQSSYSVPPSLQPGSRNSISSSIHSFNSRSHDNDLDLAFGSSQTAKRNSYSTGASDRGPDSPYRRRQMRTPSVSSNEGSVSRDRRHSRANRDRTPSTSPTRAIPRDGIAVNSNTMRTPSGNIISSIFNSQNAAAVGSALGAAASFVGSRAGITKPENPPRDEFDEVPGGYNNRPVPDTVNQNNGFNIGDAVNYLSSHLTSPQAPPPAQPQQPQQPAGSPFTLGNALNYLQHAAGNQQAPATGNNGIPQNFQLAGIDIDLKWIAQKAGEQNPWVLLGGAVITFWVISSIIATLMWYGIIAAILYVVYIVGVKNGGFEAIAGGSQQPRRRISTPGNSGGGGGWSNTGRAPGGGTEWRRRY